MGVYLSGPWNGVIGRVLPLIKSLSALGRSSAREADAGRDERVALVGAAPRLGATAQPTAAHAVASSTKTRIPRPTTITVTKGSRETGRRPPPVPAPATVPGARARCGEREAARPLG